MSIRFNESRVQVIKNSKDFFDQSMDEIKLLRYINSCADTDANHVLRVRLLAVCLHCSSLTTTRS